MKRLILLMAFSLPLFGQGQNTIFQNLFSGVTTTGISAPVRNIGQQYHVIVASGSGNCGGNGYLTIIGSYDGINFFNIGAPIAKLTLINGVTGTYGYNFTSASGAFAYVKAQIVTTFGSPCAVTVGYSGTVTGTLTGSAPYTAVEDSFTYVFGTYALNSGVATLANCFSAGQHPQVYALTLTPVGGANTATISAVDTVLGSVQYLKVPLGTTGATIWPQGSRPYFALLTSTTGVQSVTLALSAATEVDYAISYRCE